MFKSRDELRGFVAGLRIPESRRTLVELELLDHLDSRIAAELAAGEVEAKAELNALAALGEPDVLRASLETIEPAFDLDPRRALARGLASSVATTILFVTVGVLLPARGPGFAINLAVGSGIALCGLVVMWLFAPRGIGAATWAEARASTAQRIQPTTRRRAVKRYVGSILLVHATCMALFSAGLEVIEHALLAWGCLGLVYGPYALHVMRRARKERALVRTAHGA